MGPGLPSGRTDGHGNEGGKRTRNGIGRVQTVTPIARRYERHDQAGAGFIATVWRNRHWI